MAEKSLEAEPLIAVFHRWIREEVLPDHLLIDVADYRHVPEGPSIIIVGHQAQLGLDESAPGAGFLYTPRRDGLGDAASKVRDSLGWAARCAALLEKEAGYQGGFSANDVFIAIRARATTPDTVASSKELAGSIAELVAGLWGSDAVVTPSADPRALASVGVKASSGFSTVADLAAALA